MSSKNRKGSGSNGPSKRRVRVRHNGRAAMAHPTRRGRALRRDRRPGVRAPAARARVDERRKQRGRGPRHRMRAALHRAVEVQQPWDQQRVVLGRERGEPGQPAVEEPHVGVEEHGCGRPARVRHPRCWPLRSPSGRAAPIPRRPTPVPARGRRGSSRCPPRPGAGAREGGGRATRAGARARPRSRAARRPMRSRTGSSRRLRERQACLDRGALPGQAGQAGDSQAATRRPRSPASSAISSIAPASASGSPGGT